MVPQPELVPRTELLAVFQTLYGSHTSFVWSRTYSGTRPLVGSVQSKGRRGKDKKLQPPRRRVLMVNLTEIKITPRDAQVLSLLARGCSNREIAAQLSISPRTVKQHLRTLFLRAGIRDGRKRVKLATAVFEKEQLEHAAS